MLTAIGAGLIVFGGVCSFAGYPKSWERRGGYAITGIGVAVALAAFG
jgi:hypothetical protein